MSRNQQYRYQSPKEHFQRHHHRYNRSYSHENDRSYSFNEGPPPPGNSRKRPREDEKVTKRDRRTYWDLTPQLMKSNGFIVPILRGVVPAETVEFTGDMAIQKRKLYVGGFSSQSIQESDLVRFFSQEIMRVGLADHPAVIGATLKKDRGFAFIELESAELASQVFKYDGAWEYDGCQIQIRRPVNFGPMETVSEKILIENVPLSITEEQLKKYFTSIGRLLTFSLVTKNNSRHGYCEFVDGTLTDVAINQLDGMPINGQQIKLQRTESEEDDEKCITSFKFLTMKGNIREDFQKLMDTLKGKTEPTRILVLMNIHDNRYLEPHTEEFKQIGTTIQSVVSNFGEIIRVIMPHSRSITPNHVPWQNGYNQVFIEFETSQQAANAQSNLKGMLFDGRLILTSYLDERVFSKALLTGSFY